MCTERAQLKLDAAAVYTALGLNERLFICTSSQVEQLVRNGVTSIPLFPVDKRGNAITSDIFSLTLFIMEHTAQFGCLSQSPGHHQRHIPPQFPICSFSFHVCLFLADASEGAAGSRARNGWHTRTNELERHRHRTHQLWLGTVHCHAWGNRVDMTILKSDSSMWTGWYSTKRKLLIDTSNASAWRRSSR